jgi:DNA-binding NarL/FixJ family response regulator
MTSTESPAITVLIADDHGSIRTGLRLLLEAAGLAVIGEASDGRAAVTMAQTLKPDVVLMDLRMPALNGIEATRAIVDSTSSPVLIITAFNLNEEVLGAIRAGASGFVLKSLDAEELIRAVRAVARGQNILDPDITGMVMRRVVESVPSEEPPAAWPPSELTPREVSVMECLGRGMTNRLIARTLGMAETTAKSHVSSALAKLGLASRVEAALYVAAHRGEPLTSAQPSLDLRSGPANGRGQR